MASIQKHNQTAGATIIRYRINSEPKQFYLPLGTDQKIIDARFAEITAHEKITKLGLAPLFGGADQAQAPRKKKRNVTTFDEFFVEYVERAKSSGVAAKTLKRTQDNTVRIRQYVNDLPMACDTDAVEQWKSTVQTFIDERGDKELKVETMKTSLSVLNALLNRAATHGGIEKHKVAKFNLMEKSPLATFVPTWDLKVGNENTRTAYSAAEFREICQHVDLDKPELATIFTFFYMTGLRLSEGWNLTKKKIDTGSDHPFLRLSPEAQDIKSEAGKRNIPLNSSAQMVRDQILAMSNDSDFFIPRIVSSHNKLSAAFKRALVRAAAVEGSAMWQKVERPRSEDDVIGCFHCLRNSYATNVANNSNVTLSQAMRWIGHSDAKTTNKYVKVSDNEHKAAEAL